MNNFNFNKGVKKISKMGGIDEQNLKNALQSGKLENVMGTLNKGQAEKLKQVLSDKTALENLLKSDKAKEILKELEK